MSSCCDFDWVAALEEEDESDLALLSASAVELELDLALILRLFTVALTAASLLAVC